MWVEGKLHEGKVAQFLSDRQLVINIGARDGVKVGMRFAVLAGVPNEVSDPDTGEVLGVVDRIKVRVEVVQVQERLAICSTYQSVDLASAFAAISRGVPETLKIDSSIPTAFNPDESYVKIGDRVKELVEEPLPVRNLSSARN